MTASKEIWKALYIWGSFYFGVAITVGILTYLGHL